MFRQSGRVWLALLLVLSLVAISAWTGEPRGVVQFVRGLVLWVAGPPVAAVRESSRWLEGAVDTLVALRDLPERNRELESEVARLRQTAIANEELRQENERLRALLHLRDDPGGLYANGIVAAVIARSPDRWYDQLVINAGSADGVARGMAVVTPEGLVGRVSQTTAHEAVVLLLTNPDSGVGSMVQRATSRAQGVVLGAAASRSTLVMQFFSRDADVVVGDIIITSGLGGTFPRGIAIGYATQVESAQEGLVRSAQVQPAADLDRLEWVMVIP